MIFSPHWVDAVIALTVLEALVLGWMHRRHGRGPVLDHWLPHLASGFCLMVALRGALAGWNGAWIGACLTVSGLIHGIELWRRWR